MKKVTDSIGNDLNMMLREQSIFSLLKKWILAILETNGNLSVLKKAGQEPATKKDVNAPGHLNQNIFQQKSFLTGKL